MLTCNLHACMSGIPTSGRPKRFTGFCMQLHERIIPGGLDHGSRRDGEGLMTCGCRICEEHLLDRVRPLWLPCASVRPTAGPRTGLRSYVRLTTCPVSTRLVNKATIFSKPLATSRLPSSKVPSSENRLYVGLTVHERLDSCRRAWT